PDPLEVLPRPFASRERVDRVLEGDSAQAKQPTPDLDPQVAWLRRDLVDQEEPAGSRGSRQAQPLPVLDTSVSSKTQLPEPPFASSPYPVQRPGRTAVLAPNDLAHLE